MHSIDSAFTKIGIGKYHFILFLALGYLQFCASSQLMMVAFIGPVLGCFWKVNSIEKSFLSNSIFFGTVIGSLALGIFSDKHGRKNSLIVGSIGLFYTGLLRAASPTIIWIIIIHCLIGICYGGNNSTLIALLSEMTPLKYRGTFNVLLTLFWAMGSYWITLISFFIIPLFGWRMFLAFSTIPLLFSIIAFIWIPESPRYLLLHNDKEGCLKVINDIARMNKKEYITNIDEETSKKPSLMDLVHTNYLLTVIYTSILRFASGLTYYSFIIFLTIAYDIPHKCLQDMSKVFYPGITKNNTFSDNSCCNKLTWNTHKNILIATTGEIAFLPISIFLINFVGRKKTFSIYLTIISIGLVLLNLCLKSIHFSILLFILRGALRSFVNLTHIYASEVLPTSVRSVGLGFCAGVSKLGAIFSPFIVHIVIERHSFLGGTMFLFGFNFVCLIISFLLPYETQNRQLYQTADHNETDKNLNSNQEKANYKTIND